MQGSKLSNISKTVMQLFSKTVKKIGTAVNFSKRESKLNAKLFAESLVVGCLSYNAVSLENICHLLKQRRTKITKQALHQRFTPEATELMKNLFLESLQQFKSARCGVIDLLKSFKFTFLGMSKNLKQKIIKYDKNILIYYINLQNV